MGEPVSLAGLEAEHVRSEGWSRAWCAGCDSRWPCPTARACEALRLAVGALERVKLEGDCNGGTNAQLERRALRECHAIALAALADGAQTEAPAEGEEGCYPGGGVAR